MVIDLGFYNRKGEKITIEEWGALFEDHTYRFIKSSKTPKKKYGILTIWDGHDASMDFGPKRLIFSTAVFELLNKRGAMKLGKMKVELHAETEKEALEDHEQLLREWSEKE